MLAALYKEPGLVKARFGWSLRHIQKAICIRCETGASYLKAAGIAVPSPPGGWGKKNIDAPRRTLGHENAGLDAGLEKWRLERVGGARSKATLVKP
jgi:hypothetical protein